MRQAQVSGGFQGTAATGDATQFASERFFFPGVAVWGVLGRKGLARRMNRFTGNPPAEGASPFASPRLYQHFEKGQWEQAWS